MKMDRKVLLGGFDFKDFLFMISSRDARAGQLNFSILVLIEKREKYSSVYKLNKTAF